jgi:rare lipoprotein A
MNFIKTISALAFVSLLSFNQLFAQEEYTQEASVYAIGRYGKKMANGDYLSSRHRTCSHEFLPMGSLIEITNLVNKRVEVVEVNGISQTTGVELTHSVAHDLGLTGVHKANVKVLVVRRAEENITYSSTSTQEQRPVTTSKRITYGSQTAVETIPVFTNPEPEIEKVEKKRNYEFKMDFPQHERVTDRSQLKTVVKTDSVVKKKETVIKLDTEEKPSRPIPTLKMKVYDN